MNGYLLKMEATLKKGGFQKVDSPRKNREKEWVFEETVTELREVKKSEIHLYKEYLIEIVEAANGEGYFAKVYELVTVGTPHKNPQSALKNAVNFLTH